MSRYSKSEMNTLEYWISRLMLDHLFFLISRLTKSCVCILKSVLNSTNHSGVSGADKFEILRATHIHMEKKEKLSINRFSLFTRTHNLKKACENKKLKKIVLIYTPTSIVKTAINS